mgnify:CR=1 FL=1
MLTLPTELGTVIKLLFCAKLQVGNALINDETDTLGLIDYFASHALISSESSRKLHNCNFSSNAETSDECHDIVKKLKNVAGNINIYNIYYPLCLDGNLTSIPKRFSVSFHLHLEFADSELLLTLFQVIQR